ncbi:transient receptor potential cation channel subfamily V member 6-like isoform X1 [Patiria miniata]|uniref:Ion transport domain-containing protein n=1 Tax=Patiria miniata TaxID=46514 RepID=A0A913Z0G1_PATMI|nr:transient receptor potential cation channel subfamily V member 6-like isoform X1 [Patiria miniata]
MKADVKYGNCDSHANVCMEIYELYEDLVDLAREAGKSHLAQAAFEEKIRGPEISKFLYEGGNGKMVPIKTLVKIRNQDNWIDNDVVDAKDRKKKRRPISKSKKVTGSLGSTNKVGSEQEAQREFCWDIDRRGYSGETLLHVCFMSPHNKDVNFEIAKHLIKAWPKMINDFILGTESYGETCLHKAIVNENISMIKFLIENGADLNVRCYGRFFRPDDQKAWCVDSLEHEHFILYKKTNYEGLTYWGETPLTFAACLDLNHVFRSLWVKGCDINTQDTNGNTVLHMMVLQDKKDMFTLAYELGGDCTIKNKQGYTPLSLAAKLHRIDLFEHILFLERQLSWKYGSVTCASYALDGLDSINYDGSINNKSSLHLIVNQTSKEHLQMLKGVIYKLLDEKWKTFGRFNFCARLAFFLLYLAVITTAFYLRPGKDPRAFTVSDNVTQPNGSVIVAETEITEPCYLLYTDTPTDQARVVFEIITLIGSIIYLFYAAKELYHLGKWSFMDLMILAPAKAMFLLSCCFVVLACFGRIPPCNPYYEDVFITFAILTACPYSLFFLRALKLVGPFIFMIYKMIHGDLLKFLAIYLIFLFGFSQAMHIVFLGYTGKFELLDSVIGMFVMSLGEFGDIYATFDETRYPIMGKFLFCVYMVLVALLLVNMLIAMMGSTFSTIAETENEWQRQWAKIVLILEQSLSPAVRVSILHKYSTPMWDGRQDRAMIMQTENEDHDDTTIQKSKHRHNVNSNREFIDGEWQLSA